MIAGCSSGIEPIYAVSFERRVLDGTVLPEVHPEFRRRAEDLGVWSESLALEIAAEGGVRKLTHLPASLRRVFAGAHDVSPAVHVQMQARFQDHVHAGVSKTINLPASADPSVIADVFRLAHRLRCKGLTVYRDGSRSAQVLSASGAAPAKHFTCVECGQSTAGSHGCRICTHCGWSSCS